MAQLFKNKASLLLMVLLFCSTPFFAQENQEENASDDPGGLDSGDPGAPIGDYIIPMLLLGTATAFILLRKKSPQQA